jgi:type IV pilus assembly protein PilQ
MMKKLLIGLMMFIFFNNISVIAQNAPQIVQINSINCESLLDKIRITIVCDVTPSVSAFTLSEPERIVVDLIDSRLAPDINNVQSNLLPVLNIRTSQWQEEPPIVRVTIDLENKAEYSIVREQGFVIIDIEKKVLRTTPEPEAEPEKTVTMYVKDADIVDLLRMIGTQFNLNIIIAPDVKSLVTVQLTNVPYMTAIDVLVKAANCNFIKYESGIILVKPKTQEVSGELDSKIFELDYAEATDVKEALKKVLSGKGNAEVVYRRVGEGGGSKRTSTILVTDYPEYLDKINSLIAELDQPVSQISIEAKFIETSITAEDMYGIDWTLSSVATASAPKTGEMAIPIRFQELVLGKISISQLSAALDIMQSRGKSRLLANPRTVTLDNQTAEINMGISVPLRQYSIDPETRERTYTWTEKFIPIGLKVTPHTTSDGMINMEVEPKVEAITGWQGTADDLRPVTVRREGKTQVVVKDGEVVVMGGLVKDEESRVKTKLPILGDIPILGDLLFSKTTITKEKTDLIIFIIPHIIK